MENILHATRGVRSKVSDMSSLVQYQVVPHGAKPQRLPTFPQIERTSVLSFMTTTTQSTPAVEAGTGTLSLMAIRSPVFPLWKTYPTGTYTAFWNMQFDPAGNPKMPGDVGSFADTSEWLDPGRAVSPIVSASGIFLPPTPVWCLHGSKVGFYVPQGWKFCVQVVLNVTVATGTWQMDCSYCGNNDGICDGADLMIATNPGGTVITFKSTAAPWGAWYFPGEITCTAIASAASTVADMYVGAITNGTFQSVTSVDLANPFWYPVTAPPEYTSAPFIYSSTRVNAFSMLVQNCTAVLQKEGTVTAVRLPSSKKWFSDATANGLTLATDGIAAGERYFGLLEKGFYTYVAPDQRTSQFSTCVINAIGSSSYPIFPLAACAYAHVVSLDDLDKTQVSNFAITLDEHIEFRNTSQLFDIGISTLPLEDWHRAQVALASFGYFFENPTHLAVIARLARAAATTLWPIVRPHVAAVGMKILNKASGAIRSRIGVGAQATPGASQRSRPKPRAKKAKAKPRKR
jgi:hypothetical protein